MALDPLTPEQRERLKLAFAYDVARRIAGADERMDPAEAAFLQGAFPWALLESQGLVTADHEFTAEFHAARAVAEASLAGLLERDEKLTLLALFFDTAVADDELRAEEGRVVLEAARRLGLSSEDVMAVLASRKDVGDVSLPEPEEESH